MAAIEKRHETLQVRLGQSALPVGTLVYTSQGRREHCAFSYADTWLRSTGKFNISSDLALAPGYQHHKAITPRDCVFHGALADTMPDAWGRRVIAREHAKRRRRTSDLPPLTELDYLLSVDDYSRVGALRLQDSDGEWRRTPVLGERGIPPLVELEKIYQSSQAVERGAETEADLQYLRGKGTSLGGMRPKCSILEEDGMLSIGKFPSVEDERSVTRCEILALKLASMAGIRAASGRVVCIDNTPIAIIRRFDRDADGGRIPYQSAASILQASREEDRSYMEILDVLTNYGYCPQDDARQLWRRLVFNLLITNVDDHLQNHGFLHVSNGQWRLSPAFDINPFPDKMRESKVWLSEQDGPITDVKMLLDYAATFFLDENEAIRTLSEVYFAISQWRQVATSAEIGLQAKELNAIAPAFEHREIEECAKILGVSAKERYRP